MKELIFVFLLLSLIQGCSPITPQQKQQETTEQREQVKVLDDKIENIQEQKQEETTTQETNVEIECFNLINEKREAAGINILEWDDELYEYAKIRAREASVKWSHVRPDGTSWKEISPSPFQRENLAIRYKTADDVVNAWMASQGHKENALRSSFKRSAVAFYEAQNGWFWCQSFGY